MDEAREYLQLGEVKDGRACKRSIVPCTSGVFTLVLLPPEFCLFLSHNILGDLLLCLQAAKPRRNGAEASKPSMIITSTEFAGIPVFLLH